MNALTLRGGALAVLVAATFCPTVSAGEEKKSKRPSPEAVKALNEGVQLLNAHQLDQGIEKLRSVIAGFPGDPAADKAHDLLRENGIGEEIQVVLLKREVIRDKLKITEKSILELGEKVLKELSAQYKGLKEPCFKTSLLQLHYFDSQARYREKGGLITSAGQFMVTAANPKLRSMQGKIEWYYTQGPGSIKDRQTAMNGLFYHEMTHYQNAVHFGQGILPQVVDEGLAEYIASRLNTEFFQNYRGTERQRMESSARTGLSSMTRFEDFVALLDAPRALGRGDATVSRWYGQCYSIVDLLAEETVAERKSSLADLLVSIEKLATQRREKIAGRKDAARAPKDSAGKNAPGDRDAPEDGRPDSRPPGRAFVEDLVKVTFDVPLEDFHKLLVKRIMGKYKQQ
jgi:hypothetical protein